jgi:16S rRNA (guanine1207-N2)-methyltransferase
MAGEHYFSASPGSDFTPRLLTVRLAGADRTVTTAGGVFSPDRVDLGTRVLLDTVPVPPSGGNLLDLGCGWGPVALSLALESPEATVWAVDVNERALELVRRNASSFGLTNVNAVLPDEIPADVRFSTIWSNPPIRVGKAELHAMLLRWLPLLEPDAAAWLVVQKNLGADSLHRWLQQELPDGFAVERAASSKGFRVLKVTSPPLVERRPEPVEG